MKNIIHGKYLHKFAVFVAFLLISAGTLPATEPPPVPEMLPDWNPIADMVAADNQLEAIGNNLGAKPTAVRNTIYRVGENKRAQINVLVAANKEVADKIMASLKKIKSEKALLRDGNIIYEFVGANNVFANIVEARKYLEKKFADNPDRKLIKTTKENKE